MGPQKATCFLSVSLPPKMRVTQAKVEPHSSQASFCLRQGLRKMAVSPSKHPQKVNTGESPRVDPVVQRSASHGRRGARPHGGGLAAPTARRRPRPWQTRPASERARRVGRSSFGGDPFKGNGKEKPPWCPPRVLVFKGDQKLSWGLGKREGRGRDLKYALIKPLRPYSGLIGDPDPAPPSPPAPMIFLGKRKGKRGILGPPNFWLVLKGDQKESQHVGGVPEKRDTPRERERERPPWRVKSQLTSDLIYLETLLSQPPLWPVGSGSQKPPNLLSLELFASCFACQESQQRRSRGDLGREPYH